VKGRVLKIKQVKEYISQKDQLQCKKKAVNHFSSKRVHLIDF